MSKSKRIGDYREDRVKRWFDDLGCNAHRTLLSAQAGRHVNGDLMVEVPGLETDLVVESKYREDHHGYATVLKWLDEVDILALGRRGEEPVYVLTPGALRTLIQAIVRCDQRGRYDVKPGAAGPVVKARGNHECDPGHCQMCEDAADEVDGILADLEAE